MGKATVAGFAFPRSALGEGLQWLHKSHVEDSKVKVSVEATISDSKAETATRTAVAEHEINGGNEALVAEAVRDDDVTEDMSMDGTEDAMAAVERCSKMGVRFLRGGSRSDMPRVEAGYDVGRFKRAQGDGIGRGELVCLAPAMNVGALLRVVRCL